MPCARRDGDLVPSHGEAFGEGEEDWGMRVGSGKLPKLGKRLAYAHLTPPRAGEGELRECWKQPRSTPVTAEPRQGRARPSSPRPLPQ